MRGRYNARLLFGLALIILLSTACALPALSPRGSDGGGASQVNAQTLAVQTIEAMMTQVAGSSITTTPEPGGSDQQPQSTVAPTMRPSSTPIPTNTAVSLPKPSPTAACNQGKFVRDVTVPDGTVIQPNQSFPKTWRIRNAGACTWTTEYAVVFSSGNAMGAEAVQKLKADVLPGDEVEITVNLKAPSNPGTYKSEWKLRDAAGVLFGLGASGATFYAEIKVPTAASTGPGYDFTNNYCLATWTGNDTTLPCLGTDNDSKGFVLFRSKPQLETGYVDDEPGLLTNPPSVNDGWIRGTYPAYTVKDGDRFESIIGCEYNAKNCDLRFQLDYKIDGGSIQTFKSWDQSYDNSYLTVNEDLSSLAGKNVTFILTVYAKSSSNQDRGLWLLPRIKSK